MITFYLIYRRIFINHYDGFTWMTMDFAIFTVLLLHSLSNFSRQLNVSDKLYDDYIETQGRANS